MMPERIIEPGTLSLDGRRVAVSVRMPWYRALPLSSVAGVTWTVGGALVPRESITWTVDGLTHSLDDLPARHDAWWYVLDSARLEGDLPEPSGPREAQLPDADVDVTVVLELFIPYITTDAGVLTIAEKDTKTMRASVQATA